MALTSGILIEPQRIVLYGPEGIGKSTKASHLPDPVFVDIEGSTSDLDVHRTLVPGSWKALCDEVGGFALDHQGRKSLVIDTADWAEKLGIASICAANNLTALGGQNDYGHSHGLWEAEWGRFLDLLSRVAKSGMHVCLTAHEKISRIELPDQNGAFDKWGLKLEKRASAMLKEWARTILFLNHKTYVVGGKKGEKPKATGGPRVIHTEPNPCWEAKNRAGLGSELPMERDGLGELAPLFNYQAPAPRPPEPPNPHPVGAADPPAVTAPGQPAFLSPLFELMQRDSVTEHEVQLVVFRNGGTYPTDTPLANYDPQFVAGRLVANWGGVMKAINQMRQEAAAV